MAKTTEDLLDSLGGLDLSQVGANIPSEEDISNELLQELAANAEETKALAKQDLDFLAALLMPTVFKYCYPDVFQAVWQWLLTYAHQRRTFPQLALGLPRGFGKSTLMKIFLIYCILFTDRKFILVVAATAKLAQNIISDVCDMLDEPNVKAVFGDWRIGLEKDTQELKKFGFRGRNVILAAAGAETKVRGLNVKNERPDVILMDDIQSRDCADSEVQSESLENWMVGTLMKAKSPESCMFLFVANMYPTKLSILRKLKTNPKWIKFITGGILANGESLWEELQPIAQLNAEFQNDLAMGKPEIFYAEVLNDENVQANNLIDLSKLPDNPYEDGDIAAGKFIIIDPSNDKVNSDAVSIGYFEVHSGLPMMMQLVEGRFSPGETIRNSLQLALSNGCNFILCEANAYQYSLLYWFDFVCRQLGIVGMNHLPIYSGSRSKNARILDMFKSYAAGELFVHDNCKLEVHLQISQFNALKTNNTDGILDLLTYAPRVLTEYAEFLASSSVIEAQEWEDLTVPEDNSCF